MRKNDSPEEDTIEQILIEQCMIIAPDYRKLTNFIRHKLRQLATKTLSFQMHAIGNVDKFIMILSYLWHLTTSMLNNNL